MVSPDTWPLAFSYIRFSTKGQAEGGSLGRQLKASADYCERNKLRLLQRPEYNDYGVSGFRGRNADVGGLGKFVDALKDGKIPRGSFLLVENIDRITRQTPYDAVDVIKALIDGGLNIVDLSDRERIYNSETIRVERNYSTLVARCERAHEESRRKSELSNSNWQQKTAKAVAGEGKISVTLNVSARRNRTIHHLVSGRHRPEI